MLYPISTVSSFDTTTYYTSPFSTRETARPRRSYTMPALVNNTHESVALVREPHDDELYVMDAFERHARHCETCADPLQTLDKGRSLCARGQQYAIDVAGYLYSKNSRAHSVIAREQGQLMLVKIPRNCIAVRCLLLAVERGLRLPQKNQRLAPVISHDRLYVVTSRPSTSLEPEQYHQVIEREPRSLKRRRTVYTGTRGSLYNSDAVERVERTYVSTRVYRPTEYHR